MAEAVPSLTAELFDQAEVADLVEAALDGSIAFVPLSGTPSESPRPVDLMAPGMAGPIRLRVQLAGEPAAGMYPVVLSPFDEQHAERLSGMVAGLRRSSVSQVQATSSHPPGHSSVMPVESEFSGTPGERRSSVPAPRSRRRSSAPPSPEGGGGPDPLIGRVLGERYKVEFLLGVGGMGRVYNATQIALNKRIAVKVLDRSFQDDAQFAGRFHQEALAASKLDHRNVMSVIDFGQEESDGLLYIAMELLKGENLAVKIERDGAFEFPRVKRLMNQVLAALQAAHDRDIVHRDMKPENVVIVPREDDDGNSVEFVKVCDFGLAKMTDEPSPAAPTGRKGKLTVVGTVMGTPEYMSPEQCRGDVMDLRTDLYAAGVILYELITGRVPFTSDNPMDILGMHCLAQPMSPRVLNPSVSPELEAIVLRAMAKDREHRFASAREFRDALRAIDGAASVLAAAAPVIEGFEPTSLGANASVASPSGVDLSPDAPALDFFTSNAAAVPPVEPAPAPAPAVVPEQARSQTRLPPKGDPVEALMPAAIALIEGDHATREGARLAILSAGTPGVAALFRARQVASVSSAARPRWVATVRDMGEEALEPLVEALAALDPLRQDMNAELAEDLLRSVPEVSDQALADQVERFLLHDQLSIRRAALQARLSIAVPGADVAAVRALSEGDEAMQLIAISGVRRLGAVTRRVVERLDDILALGSCPDELRAAAAAALGDVDPSARAPAESALLRALQPRAKSFMGLLRGSSPQDGELLVVEAVATALLKMGGPAARRAVEKRAKVSRGDIKARLDQLLLTR